MKHISEITKGALGISEKNNSQIHKRLRVIRGFFKIHFHLPGQEN